ncbi:hypothetical protein GYB29_10735 [bacterium]|nr:hypothetical protein [bacterium]
MLGVDYAINQAEKRVHINYSNWRIDSCLNCIPSGLMEETTIRLDVIKEVIVTPWEDSYCFFKTGEQSELPFDLFSAIFFLLSRYEEYMPHTKDSHRRYNPEKSILVKSNIIDRPLINEWALILKKKLELIDSSLEFKPRKFEYISTLDIDQAWKFRHKGLKRNILGFIRDIIEGKKENTIARWPVLLGLKKDPFHNFDWQDERHDEFETKVIYFFLLGAYSKYDKNISPRKKALQKLILEIEEQDNYEIGIHPSYKSNYAQPLLTKEIQHLKNITGNSVKRSRQHYLKMKLPNTYDRLIFHRIKEDYTMGYTSHAGFRAGIAAPFYYYDLGNNRATNLKLVPFCLMDITPLHYMGMSPDEAIDYMSTLMNRVKAVDGQFVSLWHNESLSETERWKGWRKVYESMIAHAHTIQSEAGDLAFIKE